MVDGKKIRGCKEDKTRRMQQGMRKVLLYATQAQDRKQGRHEIKRQVQNLVIEMVDALHKAGHKLEGTVDDGEVTRCRHAWCSKGKRQLQLRSTSCRAWWM